MAHIIQIDLGGVNSYLAKTTQGFILFDTGGHLVMDKQFTNRREGLLKGLDAAGCTKGNLQLIVLTHGDNDHACNASYLKTHFNAPVAIHINDKELVENPNLNAWMESFQYRSFIFRIIFVLLKKTIQKITQKTLEEFLPFTPDLLLSDGFDLSPYGLNAAVIHTPGHTPGSIAILTKEGDLIAGDIFANIKKPEEAMNAVNFSQLSESIKKLKALPIKTIYPGHGAPFSFDQL